MSSEWFYSQGGQQVGPVSAQQMKEFAAAGRLTPGDLVWREGMSEWTPAARIKGLFPEAAASAAYGGAQAGPGSGVYPAQAQGGQIGYYSATSDLQARTSRILYGLPTVTGPRGDWPLSDHHLGQFAQTESYRKPIRSFNLMCRILMLLFIVASAIMLYGVVQVTSSSYARGSDAAQVWAIWLGVTGLAILHPFCGRAAMKCRLWGPITVLVFLIIGTLFTLYGLVQIMNFRYIRGPELVVPLVALVIDVLFIVLSIRAMVSIPSFLRSPVWCVEAMINARQ